MQLSKVELETPSKCSESPSRLMLYTLSRCIFLFKKHCFWISSIKSGACAGLLPRFCISDTRVKKLHLIIFFLIFCFVFSGCAKTPFAGDKFITCTIANKIDCQVEWRRGYCQDENIQGFIQCATSKELTPDIAIQISLLNNPKIQAVFEELGIAQANLLEAGLLSNPAFEVEVRIPGTPKLKTNIEYLITSSLLDILLVPLRTRLSKTEFEQTKLRVSNEIMELAFSVRETYYELIAERKKVQHLQSIVELTSIISEIFSKQLDVGNIFVLQLQSAQARHIKVNLELLQSLTEVIRLKEKLNRQLGFSNEFFVILPEDLPDTAPYGFDLRVLESIAFEERLDLQVARYEIVRLSQALGLKDWWTYTNFNAGLAGEREPDGHNLMGPGLSGELPIFNYGQAARMRLYSQLRQAQDRLVELEIQVSSEVREAHQLLLRYQEVISDYRDRLLPMQRRILTSSEELYNVMGLGVENLLENKFQEITVTQNYVESMKKYLLAKVQLDRALGGNLYKLLAQRQCIEEVYE